jgi:small GTP-binding protein
MATTRTGRVSLVGPSSTGKTALFRAIQGLPFVADSQPTVIANHFIYRNADIQAERVPELNFWDTSGNEQHREAIGIYMKRAEVAVLVIDELTRATIPLISKWFQFIYTSNVGEPEPSRIVLRNKSDIGIAPDQQLIDLVTGQSHAEYFDVSAKTGDGIRGFIEALYRICEDRRVHPRPVISAQSGAQKSSSKC